MVFSIIARAAGALALGLATNYAAEAAKEKFLRDNADLIKKAKLKKKKVAIRESITTAIANDIGVAVVQRAWQQHSEIPDTKVATKLVLRDDLRFDIISAYVDSEKADVVRVVVNGQPICKMFHSEVDHLKVLDMVADQRGDFIVGYQSDNRKKNIADLISD